jgi:hypothetical protein
VIIQERPVPLRVTIPPMGPAVPLPAAPGAKAEESRQMFEFWVQFMAGSQPRPSAP